MRTRRSTLRLSEGRVLRSQVIRPSRAHSDPLAVAAMTTAAASQTSKKRKRHSAGASVSKTPASPRTPAAASTEIHVMTSDEQVRAQPDVIQADESLVMPLDGPDLRAIIRRIEKDAGLCFKMRWYVARHVRKQFTSGVAPSLQSFQVRIRQPLWDRNAFNEERRRCGLEERVVHVPVLKTRPYNRLDFEAMRAQLGFRKDDPDWEYDKWHQVLQRSYDKYGWSHVVGQDDVDAVLAKAGADLTLFDQASREPEEPSQANDDAMEETVDVAAADVVDADANANADADSDADTAVADADASGVIEADIFGGDDIVGDDALGVDTDAETAVADAEATDAVGLETTNIEDADATEDLDSRTSQQARNDEENKNPSVEEAEDVEPEDFDLATREDHWYIRGEYEEEDLEDEDSDDDDESQPRKRRRLLQELPFAMEESLAPETSHMELLRRKVQELREEKQLLNEMKGLRKDVLKARMDLVA